MKQLTPHCRRAIRVGLRAGLIFIAGFTIVLAVLLRIALATSTDLYGLRTRLEELAFQVFGAGGFAFLLWLVIHMSNGGEEARTWAKRIAVAMVAGAIYAASFGPACWLCDFGITNGHLTWIAYRPVTLFWYFAPRQVSDGLYWWGGLVRPIQYSIPPEPFVLEMESQTPGVRLL
jgi:hypothetical protein